MSPTLRANCLINIIHVHLMISCLSLKKSPCLFRLNVIVRKQELIAVQEETQYSQEFSSYLQGLVLFCSRHAKFQRNQQNPKSFKAKDFSVKTICLKRVLLLVTQDQPAFLGVHLLVMYHLM